MAPTNEGGESVRAVEVLRTALERNLRGIHRSRQKSLWRAVVGLVLGGKLCLTGLGRSLPGATSDKHRIKAVDRLLGNELLHAELEQVQRAIALWLLKGVHTPVIAVDWTGAGPHHYEISAKLCITGRALPLLSLVFPKRKLGSVSAHREFLRTLSRVLPKRCKPILLTDAGFHQSWFDEIRSNKWDFIGRVRGTTGVWVQDTPYELRQLHRLARSKPKDLGHVLLGFKSTSRHRMILSRQPRIQGRHRLTRRGLPGRNTVDLHSSQAAREPWVLVTSLACNAPAIVRMYALRMQIEQSFRDHKSYRNGWSLRLANTRSAVRLSVLLLIASLADLAVQVAGRAIKTNVARGFQANTTRRRRVLSFFFLGICALRRGIESTDVMIARGIATLFNAIRRNAAFSTIG